MLNPQSLSPRSRSNFDKKQENEHPNYKESQEESKIEFSNMGGLSAGTSDNIIPEDQQTSKLNHIVAKFKAFENRMKNESESLAADIEKYILQTSFDQKSSKEDKFLLFDFNFFKQ